MRQRITPMIIVNPMNISETSSHPASTLEIVFHKFEGPLVQLSRNCSPNESSAHF